MKYQKEDLAQFARQLQFALDHYVIHGFDLKDIDAIVLAGLGGSGIAGRITRSYFLDSLSVPAEVVSEYRLPAWVNERTLVVLNSYSGNTEETLSMLEDARERNAKMLTLSTGGKLQEKAAEHHIQHYTAEKGFQPRMALGYPLAYLLLIIGELSGQDVRPDLERAIAELKDTEKYRLQAHELLGKLDSDKKFVIITDGYAAPVGLRFAQQIQENAKAEAFVNELPESNHNVIESYYGKMPSNFFFINGKSHARTGYRFEFLKELLLGNGNEVIEMPLEYGDLVSMLETVYVLDWLSLWVADARGKVSSDIRNINALKDYLSQR